MKSFITSISITLLGGYIVSMVVANEDIRILIKNDNKRFADTPSYYKKYIRESIVYKNNHKQPWEGFVKPTNKMGTEQIAQLKMRCYELAKESLGLYGQNIPVDKILIEAKKIQKFLGV